MGRRTAWKVCPSSRSAATLSCTSRSLRQNAQASRCATTQHRCLGNPIGSGALNVGDSLDEVFKPGQTSSTQRHWCNCFWELCEVERGVFFRDSDGSTRVKTLTDKAGSALPIVQMVQIGGRGYLGGLQPPPRPGSGGLGGVHLRRQHLQPAVGETVIC